MTKEEIFVKNYPEFCCNGEPLSPYWDLFSAGYETGKDEVEADLATVAYMQGAENQKKKTDKKLTEAKDIIKKFWEFVNNTIEYDPEHPQEHTDLWNELCERAEAFLKEE